jgi:outer membrane lipoprotein-sorting protein
MIECAVVCAACKELCMSRPKRVIPVVFAVVFCLSLPLLAQAPAMPQFSAEMKMTTKAGSAAGKLYFGGQKIRVEMTTQGHSVIMINDTQRKVSDMLMPEQKMYMETSTDSSQMPQRGPMAAAKQPAEMHSYDPSNPCAGNSGTTCQKLGSESVNGRQCDKWQFSNAKGGTQTLWIDQKLHFPIRTQSSDSTWELSNVKEGAPEASLFEIPAGYQKFDMGAMMQGMQGTRQGTPQR